jgi:DDE_Tnp_1-associated
MPASLLEILRSIPDHRRAEGKRFDLATVLLYSILGMVAGANSYRQMHEFIRIHLPRIGGAAAAALRIRRRRPRRHDRRDAWPLDHPRKSRGA